MKLHFTIFLIAFASSIVLVWINVASNFSARLELLLNLRTHLSIPKDFGVFHERSL
jgi:hypothetical protein